MSKINVTDLLSELKRIEQITTQCIFEIRSAQKSSSINAPDFWGDFLSDLRTHIVKIEQFSRAMPSSEDGINSEIIWVRSLAKKLDYFESKDATSWPILQQSVDRAFVLTIP